MSIDPLQKVLQSEANARAALEAARQKSEVEIRMVRINATKIATRNEHRTESAIERAESLCVNRTLSEIDQLEAENETRINETREKLRFELDSLVRQRIKHFWPEQPEFP